MRGKEDEDRRVIIRPEARLTIHVSREVRMKKLKMRKKNLGITETDKFRKKVMMEQKRNVLITTHEDTCKT